MARPKKETKSKEVKVVSTKKCSRCGIDKKVNSQNYYKSYSILYEGREENRMDLCKECLLSLADGFKLRFGSENKALYEVCKLLDVYYEKNLFDSAVQNAEKINSNTFQIYFQKALSLPQYKGKTFNDSEPFDVKTDLEEIMSENGDEEAYIRWGIVPKDDLEFLEYNYNQWVTRHQCETRAEEILYEEICQMQLDIKKTRQTSGDAMKKVEALQKLMASANIRPLDQNAMNVNENMMLWGTVVATIEQNEPCEYFDEEKRKEYKDFKGYRYYFNMWIRRPLVNLLASHKDYNIIAETEYDAESVDK